MFKEIRLKKRELSKKETIDIVNSGEYGVLSSVGPDNYPYSVPLNYVYHNDKIYFHCAVEGHKLENIKFNSNVSFCIVNQAEVNPAKFDLRYKSAILFGKASQADDVEKREALTAILQKFSSEHMEAGEKYVQAMWDKTKVFSIEIERLTGKGA